MKFEYEAYKRDGSLVAGELSVQGKGEALEQLLKKGLRPVSLIEAKGRGLLAMHLFESIDALDLLFVARNLAASLHVGMDVINAVTVIAEDVEKDIVREMLKGVLQSLKGGSSFAQAFTPYEKHFPPMFIGMIEAGEISGNLAATLTTFADYVERSHEFQNEVRAATIYPIILSVASLAVSILLILFLVPRLSAVFENSQAGLPWITRFMVGISNALTYSYLLDLAVIVFVVGIFTWLLRTRLGKEVFGYLSISIPGIRDIVKKAAVVRFARTLGTLNASGVGILESIELAGKSVGNEQYRLALLRTSQLVMAGTSLSDALKREKKLFPRALMGMIGVGEQTGNLSQTLISVAEFYEKDTSSRLKKFTSTIEPVLILVMGVVVGAIALSVLLPIYQLVNVVK